VKAIVVCEEVKEVAWWMNGSRRTEYLYGWELARVERPAKERP